MKKQKPLYKKPEDARTPLERAVGLKVSEDVYDLLDIDEQIIIDLRIAHWDRKQIAELYDVAPETITYWLRRIRLKLAESQLLFNLEMKQHYKEQQALALAEITHKTGDE